MDAQLAALFEVLRGVVDKPKREDVDEVSAITGMSLKASRKLLKKYRGNKDDALLAWFDKDVDPMALEAASDSDNEDESEVTEQCHVRSDWPLFPEVVEWITASSGCTIDLSHVQRPSDEDFLHGDPGTVLPAECLSVPAYNPPYRSLEQEEKELFAGLSIGQPVRVKRYCKEMKRSRSGWKDDAEFDQRGLCGRVGTVRAVTRRDLTARIDFNGFGSGWWDIRWLEPFPRPVPLAPMCGCKGYALLRGEKKQVKLAQRCIAQITTVVRVGSLGVFLGPVRKAVEQVVPLSAGEVVWRTLTTQRGDVGGYQLAICDPRVVGSVCRCIHGELTMQLDRRTAVSEEVVTRVAKLARAKTGCVVVSAPRGDTKMEGGAMVLRNPRCWIGGNVDGLEGNSVAPGVVIGTDSGRAQVFWLNSGIVATHRWGFDDTFDLVLMPCFAPVGRLAVGLVSMDRVMGLTWDVLVRAVREALTMEGADMVREVLSLPQFKWTGERFDGKIDTIALARKLCDKVTAGWAADGILPPPLVSNELQALVHYLQMAPPPLGGHLGMWREAKATVHKYYCSTPARREGPLCQHPGGAIQQPHWGCCGQHARQGMCRQIATRQSPLHKHTLQDRTMCIISWACDKCKSRSDAQQAQRWRCDTCQYDLCDPCLQDSLHKEALVHISVPPVDPAAPPLPSVQIPTITQHETVTCSAGKRCLILSLNPSETRQATEVSFSATEDGTQPVLTFSNPDTEQLGPFNGPLHGFTVNQRVHATKDIFVAVSVAVHQGCHGTVTGPSTSGDPRRVCVKFDSRETKINVMPLEIRPLLKAPRRARVMQVGGKTVPLRSTPSSLGDVVCDIPNETEVQVSEDCNEWAKAAWKGHEGYLLQQQLRELNTQSTMVTVRTQGLPEMLRDLNRVVQAAGLKCTIQPSFDLSVGGKLMAVIVSGVAMEEVNGIYLRCPAEEECRVMFKKDNVLLYYFAGWWKLGNARKDPAMFSSRTLVGQWSVDNAKDSNAGSAYPTVEVALVKTVAVPTLKRDEVRISHRKTAVCITAVNGAMRCATSDETFDVTSLSYKTESSELVFEGEKKRLAVTVPPTSSLPGVLGGLRGLVPEGGVQLSIPSKVDIYEESPSYGVPTGEAVTMDRLAELTTAAVKVTGGDAVHSVVSKFSWRDGRYHEKLSSSSLVSLARQLHELVGEKLTADISLEVMAPVTSTLAIVGPPSGRQKAKGFLSRLHDLQEVAVRVPSENHAVVERHRSDIQRYCHTHMNVGFGGAIVRLTGTAGSIKRARRAIAMLLMVHWREQQRQRREVVLEQVVATAIEVTVKVPLTKQLHSLFRQSTVTIPKAEQRHDELEAERKQGESRLLSLIQELSREYQRLASSLASQLQQSGVTGMPICTDNFMRGDRVVRGPTWQWGDQDGGDGSPGSVLGSHDEDGWVVVEWDKSGKLARHRTGPLYQDLQHAHTVRLPRIVSEGEPVAVLKTRTAAHMVQAMDVFRRCAICKAAWAEEEHRQRGIVHEARIGVKEMEAAEKFQGWLRDLFGVREKAELEMSKIKDMVVKDGEELVTTLLLLDKWDGEVGNTLATSEDEGGEEEVHLNVVLETMLEGPGTCPFDVASRRSVPSSNKLKLPRGATVLDCKMAIDSTFNIPFEKQRLWAFTLRPNGTFRPKALCDGNPNESIKTACQHVPRLPIQVLVEVTPNTHPVSPRNLNKSSESVSWKVLQADGYPGAALRPTKDSGPTKEIPNGCEVEVLEEDGEWARVRWNSTEGYLMRRNITTASTMTRPLLEDNKVVIFLKYFDVENQTITRKGFVTLSDPSVYTVQDLIKVMRTRLAPGSSSPPSSPSLPASFWVFVEVTPEFLRHLTSYKQSLSESLIVSGSILVFQAAPPYELQRLPSVGDTVMSAVPCRRRGVLKDGEGKVVAVNRAESQITAEGAHKETYTYHESAIMISPRSIGLPYTFGTAPAMYNHIIHRLTPRCRAHHTMSHIENPRKVVCSVCHASGSGEMAFWGCRGCAYDLCLLCAMECGTTSPELSPRAKPWVGGRLVSAQVRSLLTEHTDRMVGMLSSLDKHYKLLDETVREVLLHIRRMGEHRQQRRRTGWDLLLHMMDTTGCLIELLGDHIIIVGRPLAVERAKRMIDDLQQSWPPPSVPTFALVEVGQKGIARLMSGAGMLTKALQFECGLQEVEVVPQFKVLLKGPREDIKSGIERLCMVLDLTDPPNVDWEDMGDGPERAKKTVQSCPICLDDAEEDDGESIKLGCGHLLHVECGRGYVASRKGLKESIPCSVNGCSYVLCVAEFGALTDAGQRSSEYYNNLLREALLKHDKVVACPFPGCPGWAVAGSVTGAMENLHCFECDKLFCPICRQMGHFFSQCEEVHEASLRSAGKERRKKLEQEEESRKAIAELCRPCPRCGAQVSRTEGCPHMTCKVCKFEFCYDCLRAIPHVGVCDKAKLADRMKRVRAEHGGVIYHKYTCCDGCGKHPIPDTEEAFTCLNCLHWSICGVCKRGGATCGNDEHILAPMPRSDEPPAEALVKGEKQKWRLKLNEVPHYDIPWESVICEDTPLSAGAAPTTPVGAQLGSGSGWDQHTRSFKGLDRQVTPKDGHLAGLNRDLSGTLAKAETMLFEWEESDDSDHGNSSILASVRRDSDNNSEGSVARQPTSPPGDSD